MPLLSITRRIWRTYFLLSVGITGVMVAVVVYVNEAQEETLRELTFVNEKEFFLSQQVENSQGAIIAQESANLTAVFVPDALVDEVILPEVFAGLPQDYVGEIRRGQRWYLVDISRTHGGRLYSAWDITRHEEQEVLYMMILVVASLIILALSLASSVLVSRRLTIPLKKLSEAIRATPVGEYMPRLVMAYSDAELAAIAVTFNQFLNELESFVKREKKLVSLASHEMRTPIAVIRGALDILENRGQLQGNDAATLMRLRNAAREMEENTNILLKLSRRVELDEEYEDLCLQSLVQETLDELSAHVDEGRVHVEVLANSTIRTHSVLAKMLIRNLVKNALEHTVRDVWLRLSKNQLEIVDAGNGMSQDQQALLSNHQPSETATPEADGLGLYIATLVCERLGWRIRVDRSGPQGTVIQLCF